MAITIKCDCGRKLSVPDTSAGKRARCPKCNQVMDVPAAEKDPWETADEEDEYQFGDDDSDAPPPSRRPGGGRASSGSRKPKRARKAAKNQTGLILGLVGGGLVVVVSLGALIMFVMGRGRANPPPVVANPPMPFPATAIPVAPAANVPPAAVAAPAAAPVIAVAGGKVWVELSNFKMLPNQGGSPFNNEYSVDYRIASGAPDILKQYVLLLNNSSGGGMLTRYIEIDVSLQSSGTINFATGMAFGATATMNARMAYKNGYQEWGDVSGRIVLNGSPSPAQAPPSVQEVAGAAAQGKQFAIANARLERGLGAFPTLMVELVLQSPLDGTGWYYLVVKSGTGGGFEIDVSRFLRRAKVGEPSTVGGQILGGVSGPLTMHIEKRNSPGSIRLRNETPEIVSNSTTAQ